ncbi:acyl-CoA dehydrogenase family protein [Kutzneria sp. CA-103260]|uniref:acyl-CoA dehydrogenase family protein n=1 Tax=Kutzneria sp. CA-103260 TaxID=2802641 RepID=UPI001BABC464|nr:acyl-CoA dehydrogenase family protein [Kutzneria sp. CA-103260]QUQ63689.1 glutaryl-CoA dehydrogenase [Kutzneria sp. CA-103260]
MDFYRLADDLPDPDLELLDRLRTFLDTEVAPVANWHWARERFPHHLIEPLGKLDIGGLSYAGHGLPGRTSLLDGFVTLELASTDPSFATFFGVHTGLAMGSIYLCGSEGQKERWLPPMHRFEKIGAFGLTEPAVGSAAARGLTTTARRDGDEWVLTGEKKWIGNATFADVTVIWAKDEADGQVKGFLVEQGTPGFTATKIEGKIALRTVQNAHIELVGCRVPEANRLQNARSFADTAAVLRMTRTSVAWQAVGCSIGAYRRALAYAREREQFGRPIGGFQLVQDLLVRMLGNITSSLCMVAQLSRLQDAGKMTEEQASLAKAFCTTKMRETVGMARELMGGNGILLEHEVGRFVADAEAIHSYEGTREMNTLIVGRALTGQSAFV